MNDVVTWGMAESLWKPFDRILALINTIVAGVIVSHHHVGEAQFPPVGAPVPRTHLQGLVLISSRVLLALLETRQTNSRQLHARNWTIAILVRMHFRELTHAASPVLMRDVIPHFLRWHSLWRRFCRRLLCWRSTVNGGRPTHCTSETARRFLCGTRAGITAFHSWPVALSGRCHSLTWIDTLAPACLPPPAW